LDEEINFLKYFNPSQLIVSQEKIRDSEEIDLALEEVINHPNPMKNWATFCYSLTSDADEVRINIYTISGRKVRTILRASALSGYNEEIWQAEDDNGKRLANGTYIYKIEAKRADKEIQKIGKLSIVR
jgi:flagellar hook assembly protein FlgD